MQQLDYYPHGSTPTPDPYNQRPPPTLSPQSDGFGEYDPQTKSKKQNSRKEFSVLREFNEQSLTSKNEQFTQQSKVESDRKDDDKESKSKLDGKGRNEGDDMEIINKFLKKLLENEQTRAAASVFIENVSNSLDDEELEAVVQAVRVQNKLDSAKEKPEQTNWGRVVNRKLILDGDDEESVSERKNKTFSKPVIDDNDDDSEEQEQKLTEEKKKKPKPHKTELDLLHDDIRLMFISDGVLTATGRRMCCLLKDDTTKTISESFDMKAPENQKQLNLMRSVRVIIPVHENLDKMNVRNRSIDEEEICSKEDSNDERVKEKEQSEKSSKKQEKKSLTSPSRVSHKKRGAAWANGIIPKSKRKKKVETEKAPQTGEVSVGLDKVELEVNVPLALLEPDKNYFCSKTGRSKKACKLCCFNGRGIAHHYRQEHPEYEVLSSRLRPTKAKEAIEESIRLKLDESEDCPLAPQQKYAFKCRFCDTVMNTRPSSFFDHISSHTGEYRHLCMLCSFGSSMRKCLGFHYKNVHGTLRERKVYSVKSNVYGYICLECNFVQIKKKSVEDHVNIYHLGEGNKIMKIHLSSIEITSGEGVKPTVPKPVKKRPNKEDETESEPPVKKKKPNEEDLPDGNKEQEQPPVEKKKPNEEVLPDKNKEQEQPPVKADEQLEALTLLSRLDASDKKKEVDLDPTVKFEEEAPNLNIVKDLDEEEEQKEEEDESLATPNEEVEEEIEIEIVKDATNEKKIKEVDMAVFTCNTDLQEEINQERLEKMMQLNDCIKVKRQALSIVEKLSNRLLQENSLKSDPEDNPTVESDLEVVTPLKERVFQKVNINIEGTIETILKPQNEVRTVLSAGFLDIVKKSDNLEYACRVSSCSFMSKDRDVFIAHLNKDHKKDNQNYKLTRCFICQTEIVATPEEGVLIKFFVHVEERHLGIRQIECEKDVVKTVPLIDEPSKAKGDGSTVLSAGFLDIIKELDGFEYVCRVPNCRFTSKDRKTFVNHWNDDHMKVTHDYKMIKCRICQSEVGATLEKTLLMNFFTHVEEKHFEASGIEKSNPFSFTISEVKSLDPVEGSQNFTTESVVSLAEDKDKEEGGFAMEASPSLAEDNDATFTIENVVSLAEDPEDPTPSASAKAPPTRARTKSKPSKPWKTTTALRVFLQHPKKLYKCPQFTCYFATNKRDLFDSHLEIHAGVNDELVCCVYCDVKTFITYAGLHIDLYHASCLYSCSQCLYRALRREYVMVHMKIKHKGVTSIIPLAPKSLKASAKKQKSFTVNETCNPYKCGYEGRKLNMSLRRCTEQFLYQNEYMTHLEEGHDGSMVCGCVNNNLTCTYKSAVASDMIDHWRTHNCYNFHCLICQVGCMELSTMLEHYSTTHPNREPIVVDRRNSPEVGILIFFSRGRVKVETCFQGEHFGYTNGAFARIKYVKRELFDSVSPHQQTAEVIQVEDDENVVATKDKTENQLLSEEMLLAKYGKMCDPAEKELKCPICLEFKTTKISYFVYHLLLELKCHRFKCDVCSYCSITFGTMAIHCQDEHNDTILSNVTECPVDKRVLLWIQLVMKFQAKAITSQFFFESGEEAQSLFRNTQCDYCGRW
ncbi:Trypan PARP domain containing protein [Asbolus verrucosus]|uniref:Trypan PARP domain containing protein n=1 Tax=Asbolus verrucosus TaxID=1661398 RepID=A0A482VUV5_ASBVE|nr:Trypan PARP domain containing protein [Asbolus verrucosus]